MPSLVTMVRNLQRRKSRRRQDVTIAEGLRLAEDALEADADIRGAIVSTALERSTRGAALLERLAGRGVTIEEVGPSAFQRVAETEHPQGVLVLVGHRAAPLEEIVPRRRAPAVVLDGLQDPGNVGTVLRTAFALGAVGAVLVKGTADVTNPKVVRSAAGATFRLPVARAQPDEVRQWVARHDITPWVTAADGAPLSRQQAPERLALVLGSEATGVRDTLRGLSTNRVAIPLARGAESLNVAVAAGIILYEVTRAP